jgi:lipopolysaccharide/colanic/teichoic acid biosynthesis glycosyltransferase
MTAKRALDVSGSLLALVVLSPVLIAAAVAVRVASGSPILYRGERVGRHGRHFLLLKFRTMTVEADGPAFTIAADPRVTRVGRVLRRSKVDELPQLVNVLRGDMSLVGPRPEDSRFVACYTRQQRQVLAIRPGLTSPAAVRYRDEEALLAAAADPEAYYVGHVLPAKLALDLAYVRRAPSVVYDLVVLWRTFVAVLGLTRGTGVARRAMP